MVLSPLEYKGLFFARSVHSKVHLMAESGCLICRTCDALCVSRRSAKAEFPSDLMSAEPLSWAKEMSDGCRSWLTIAASWSKKG
jgi:hypothetical protein